MNIKDFLEDFNGINHIKVFDRFNFKTRRYNNAQEAINDCGYHLVRNWTIESNILKITIQSQF